MTSFSPRKTNASSSLLGNSVRHSIIHSIFGKIKKDSLKSTFRPKAEQSLSPSSFRGSNQISLEKVNSEPKRNVKKEEQFRMSNNQSVSDANSQNDDLFDMLEPTPVEYSNMMDYKVQKIQESTYKP